MKRGTKLADRYEIQGLLGRGGMGIVYRAHDSRLDRPVAVKIIPVEDDDHAAFQRFQNEARTIARMDHPHIVPVYDLWADDEVMFFVMPVVDGRSLRELLDAGPLSPLVAALVGIQLADALDYSHSLGVVHRDVKPENVMVVTQDRDLLQIKVMDFGVATPIDAARETEPGIVWGTPSYVSPEMVLGQPIDARGDVYSLGAVLYECVSGAPPFDGTVMSVLYRVVDQAPAPLPTRAGDPANALHDIIMRCLAKDREARPQSAAEVVAALESYVAIARSSHRRAPVSTPAPPLPSRSVSNVVGDLLLVHGEYVAARQAFEAAREAQRGADATIPPNHEARYLIKLANLEHKLGRYDEVLERCTHGIDQLGDGHHLLAAELHAAAALACCSAGRFEEAEHWIADGQRRIEQGAPACDPQRRRVEAVLYRSLGNMLTGLGRPAEAVSAYESALEHCDAAADRWEYSIALFNVGDAHTQAGDYAQARPFLDRAYEEKTAIGDRWGLAYTHHARAMIHLDRDELDEALREAQSGARLAQEVHDPKLRSMHRIVVGRLMLARDEVDQAEKAFALAKAEAESCDAQPEIVAASFGLRAVHSTRVARAHERAGRAEQARTAEAEARTCLLELGTGRETSS